MSMGLAVVGPKDNIESIYERADRALYKSKELGRNRLYTITESKKAPTTAAAVAETTESYEDFKASFEDA